MQFSSIDFKLSDVIKLLGFLVVTLTMWNDLKTEFAVHKAEHVLLEYRLASLERCTGCYAILPKETKIETTNK